MLQKKKSSFVKHNFSLPTKSLLYISWVFPRTSLASRTQTPPTYVLKPRPSEYGVLFTSVAKLCFLLAPNRLF